MGQPMYNHDFDVVYQGLSQSVRHTEKCTHTHESNREAVEELIQMAEGVLHSLNKLEFLDRDV
jgi:hypothetical protein